MDLLARSHHGQPACSIFQLTDVARPVETGEVFRRGRGEHLGLAAQFRGGSSEEVTHEQGDILPTFPQGREMDTYDVEAVEEILTKAPLLDQGL